MNLYSNFITNIIKMFTKPFGIGDNYVDVMGVGIVIVIAGLVSNGLVLGLIVTKPVVDLGL